jgi:hypothetical protein
MMKIFPPRDTPENFWQTLTNAGLTHGDLPADPARERGDQSPWYVKVMLGVGAWISSLLFLVFVGLMVGSLFDNAPALTVLGLIACAAAAVYFRRFSSSVFLDQVFFVLALLGPALVIAANYAFRHSWSDAALVHLSLALFEILVLIAIPYTPSRFLSALSALSFLYLAALPTYVLAAWFIPLCLVALAAALHYQWKLPRLLPAVAAALSLSPLFNLELQPDAFRWLWETDSDRWLAFMATLPRWVWSVSLIVIWLGVWLGVIYTLLKQVTRNPFAPENTIVWLLALLLAGGIWLLPLALFALAVFFLGFSQRDKVLQGIGILQLLWIVGHYYYSLEQTLLFKSLTLAGLGAVLLLLYAASHYWLPKTAAAEPASGEPA